MGLIPALDLQNVNQKRIPTPPPIPRNNIGANGRYVTHPTAHLKHRGWKSHSTGTIQTARAALERDLKTDHDLVVSVSQEIRVRDSPYLPLINSTAAALKHLSHLGQHARQHH